MPQATILNPFIIRLRERRSPEFLDLSELPTGENFRDVFMEFLTELQESAHVDQEYERGLKIGSLRRSRNTIQGQLKSGQYGFAAELENIETGEVSQRTPDDCEYIPLYFRCDFMLGANEAILVIQRYGVHGAKSALQTSLQEYLNHHFQDQPYTLIINPLITQAAIAEALGGEIEKIRYLKTTIPADIADDLHLDQNSEIEGELELVVKTKRGNRWGIPQWMRNYANGELEVSDYLEINEITYDEVRLSVNASGKTKTVPLKNLRDRIRMNIDVSSLVNYGDDGHPTFQSVKNQVSEKMEEFYSALGWED